MNAFQRSLLVLLPLTPYVSNFPAQDDSVSHWSVEGDAGFGQFAEVHRTCDGRVLSVDDYSFTDFAANIRYTNEPLTVSLTGGTSSAWIGYRDTDPYSPNFSSIRQSKSIPYCVPTIGFDTKYFALEGGVLTTFGQARSLSLGANVEMDDGVLPAGSIRIGNREKFNFSFGIARNIPLNAGGGLADLGFSTPMGVNGSRVFLGIGWGQYDRPIFSVKPDIILGDRCTLIPRIAVKAGDAFEYGLSIGGRLNF